MNEAEALAVLCALLCFQEFFGLVGDVFQSVMFISVCETSTLEKQSDLCMG